MAGIISMVGIISVAVQPSVGSNQNPVSIANTSRCTGPVRFVIQ